MKALLNNGSLIGDMDTLNSSQVNKKIVYLEIYLEEHPDQDRVLTKKMREEITSFGANPDNYSRFSRLQRLYHIARRTRKKEREEKITAYKDQWKDYELKLDLPTHFDQQNDWVDVELTRQDGKKYWAQFFTHDFIVKSFEKDKESGECANGTYFWAPNMIIVKEITEENMRRTIDDLIATFGIDECFSEREED